jgi:hypothetical protein
VLPIAGLLAGASAGVRGGGPLGLRTIGGGIGREGGAAISVRDRGSRGIGSRDKGRIVSVTLDQRACSSGDRPRTCRLDPRDATLWQ